MRYESLAEVVNGNDEDRLTVIVDNDQVYAYDGEECVYQSTEDGVSGVLVALLEDLGVKAERP